MTNEQVNCLAVMLFLNVEISSGLTGVGGI